MQGCEPEQDTRCADEEQESPKRLRAPVRVNLRSIYVDLRAKQTALWSEIEGLEDGIAFRTDLMMVIEGTRRVVGDALMSCGDTGAL